MTRVSVIMPMRNAEPYVADALASVLQEHQIDIEVVVVDDGSTDHSRDRVLAVPDPRIRLINGPQQGISECLNAGFSQAFGDILMRCDADDLFPAGRIAAQVAWLEENPQYGAVCGGFCTMDERGRPVAQMGINPLATVSDISNELQLGETRTSLCTFAIRRTVAAKVGPFRPYFETSEDIDYLLRLGEFTGVAYVAVNTYHYRLHQASVTHTQVNPRRAFFDTTARDFQKQRTLAGRDALQDGCPPLPPADHQGSRTSAALHVQSMLMGQAWRLAENGQSGTAWVLALRAVGHEARSWAPWRALVLIPVRAVVSMFRRRPS